MLKTNICIVNQKTTKIAFSCNTNNQFTMFGCAKLENNK